MEPPAIEQVRIVWRNHHPRPRPRPPFSGGSPSNKFETCRTLSNRLPRTTSMNQALEEICTTTSSTVSAISRQGAADSKIISSGTGNGIPNNKLLSKLHMRRSHLVLARMVLAEMVGTFLLVFSTCGVLASLNVMRLDHAGGLLEYALTGGFAIATAVFSVGHISGAHVNPSITVAFATIGRFQWSKVPFYVAGQVAAAILASWVGKAVYRMPAGLAVTRPYVGRGEAFFAEFFGTMFISLHASLLAVTQHAFSGLAIGTTVALSVLISGPISGGSMNPARSIGPAVIARDFANIWIYIVAPIAGAITGALLFRLLHISDFDKCRRAASTGIPTQIDDN